MNEQQNVGVVRQACDAFGRGDAVRDFFGVLLTTFEITNFTPSDFLAQGLHAESC